NCDPSTDCDGVIALLGPHLSGKPSAMNNTDMRPRRRSRLVVMPLALVIVLAGLWSAFWFYAASTAETQITRWREREASFGRVQTCASQSVAGYPFRIEVRCNDAGLELRAPQSPMVIKTTD